jgi:hypothetical protein
LQASLREAVDKIENAFLGTQGGGVWDDSLDLDRSLDVSMPNASAAEEAPPASAEATEAAEAKEQNRATSNQTPTEVFSVAASIVT